MQKCNIDEGDIGAVFEASRDGENNCFGEIVSVQGKVFFIVKGEAGPIECPS